MKEVLDIEEKPLPDLVQTKPSTTATTTNFKSRRGRPRKNPHVGTAALTMGAIMAAQTCLGLLTQTVDWSQHWHDPVEQAYANILNATEDPDELEVVRLEYCLISNEYSQRDEWWLFDEKNPESSRWI